MPSLFSKLRHKKTPSTSDNITSPSTPGLPSQSQSTADKHKSLPSPPRSNITSPSTPALPRASLDRNNNASPTPPVPSTYNPNVTVNPARRAPPPPASDTVVISANNDETHSTHLNHQSHAGTGLDSMGHTRPFGDESNRPELPTTSSNAHNPTPDPSSLTWHADKSNSHLQPDTHNGVQGSLSPLAEFRSSTPQDLPLPPGAAAATSPPPPVLPHVTSVNNQQIKEVERHRPKPVISGSNRFNSEEGQLGGQFGHVDTMGEHRHHPSTRGQGGEGYTEGDLSGRSGESTSNASLDKGKSRRNPLDADIPSREPSLLPGSNDETTTAKNNAESDASPQTMYSGRNTIEKERLNAGSGAPFPFPPSARRGEVDTTHHLASSLANLSFHGPRPIRSERDNLDSSHYQAHPDIEKHRSELVSRITSHLENRRDTEDQVNNEGRKVFEAVGIHDLLNKEDTIDIKTRWLRPVIQETIIPREHTEHTTIIEREIHRHHIYPKIQPIEDPDPIILTPRHRIFSSTTGKWHEVVGDEAAIAILGEDVFHNGPKEVRQARHLALPGFNGEPVKAGHELPRTESHSARDSYGGTLIESLTEGYDGDDLTEMGFGTGGKGQVVERQGRLGEKLGDWKDAVRGQFFGSQRDDIGRAV